MTLLDGYYLGFQPPSINRMISSGDMSTILTSGSTDGWRSAYGTTALPRAGHYTNSDIAPDRNFRHVIVDDNVQRHDLPLYTYPDYRFETQWQPTPYPQWMNIPGSVSSVDSSFRTPDEYTALGIVGGVDAKFIEVYKYIEKASGVSSFHTSNDRIIQVTSSKDESKRLVTLEELKGIIKLDITERELVELGLPAHVIMQLGQKVEYVICLASSIWEIPQRSEVVYRIDPAGEGERFIYLNPIMFRRI